MANTKITSRVLADNAVLTANITDANVTTAKVADNAVTGDKVADDVALAGNPTTTTQSAGNNTTRIATTAFVSTAVADLADSAPDALNTLNELAAAMGDDANFSTTITNSIAAKLPLAGGTMTGDLALADNAIAKFGAGSDLQIYHDGFHSNIKETGAGSLIIDAANTIFRNADATKSYAVMTDGGSVELYHNNLSKLATTATGIDVTGTATMDGLTVDGTSDLNGNVTIGTSLTTLLSGNDIDFQRAGDSYLSQTGGGALNIRTNDGVSNKVRLNLATNGDISFYEDTGTTAKFFWDASAESLGIGTTSPATPLQVVSTAGDWTADIKNYSTDAYGLRIDLSGSTGTAYAQATYTATGTGFFVKNNGNVGIGTSSPSKQLEIRNDTATTGQGGAELRLTRGDSSGVANDPIGTIEFYNTDADGAHVSSFIKGISQETYARQGALTFGVSQSNSTDATEAMRIDSSGRLLVNTTSAINAAHTFQVTQAEKNVAVFNNTVTSGNPYGIQLRYSGAGSGTGGDAYTYYTNSSGSFVLKYAVRATGDVVNANNSYGQVSDRKLKENIVDATNKLDELKQIKIRNFNFIGDDTKQIGVVAQELETIFPALITDTADVDADGNELGTTTKEVKYSVLLPIVIKAIQEQQEQIETLKKEVEELKGG